MKAHLGRAKAGDYVAMLAYIDRTPAHITAMQKMRHAVRDKKKLATCLGFGPRFLHSTGQAYKGGPNSGVFLQITTSDPADLPVPGAKYTFGIVKSAQARGDFGSKNAAASRKWRSRGRATALALGRRSGRQNRKRCSWNDRTCT